MANAESLASKFVLKALGKEKFCFRPYKWWWVVSSRRLQSMLPAEVEEAITPTTPSFFEVIHLFVSPAPH